MDDRLIQILAKKLKISDSDLKSSYVNSLKEYIDTVEKKDARTHHCVYKFVSGENSGKVCGLLPKHLSIEASCEIDEAYYCKAHYKTISEKKRKSQTLKLTGLDKTFVFPDEKLETEHMGDFEVLKGTMLIVDREKNCCSGKLIENQPTSMITKGEEELLKEKKIPHHRCRIEEETSEEIKFEDL